jgi:type II secretory pathway pseudopilin PulG
MGKLAHNSFLSVLVELGIVGLALFGIILSIALIEVVRQPKWDARFWLTMLAMWLVGASALTYEYRKATWLFLSFAVASAALARHREEVDPLVEVDEPGEPPIRQRGLELLQAG